MAYLIDHNLLDAIIGYIYVIKLQKWDLPPDAHVLLIMDSRVSYHFYILYQPCMYDQ